MTLEALQQERDNLQAALFRGVRSIQEGDRRMEYSGAAEMQTVLDRLDREIARLSGVPASRHVVITAKGI